MNKAEKYLHDNGIPNIEWANVSFQDDVKDGMAFPNSMAETLEAYHQSRVNAISAEEINKYNNKLKKKLPLTPNDFIHGIEHGAKWFKNKLLKQ